MRPSWKFVLAFTLFTLVIAMTLGSEVRTLFRIAVAELSYTAPPKMQPLPSCKGCNLVLISLDTFRADRVSRVVDGKSLTPNLDAILKQSIEFTSAYTNAFFTTPSHMTVFTSLYPSTHRVEGRKFIVSRMDGRAGFERRNGLGETLDKKYQTIAEALSEGGYKTYWQAPMGFRYFSFDDGFARGFQNFHESPFVRGNHFKFKPQREFGVSRLSALQSNNPVFMFLHSYVSHMPLVLSASSSTILPITSEMVPEFLSTIKGDNTKLTMQMDKAPDDKTAAKLIEACSKLNDLSECYSKIGADVFFHALGTFQHFSTREAYSYLQNDERPKEVQNYVRAYDESVADLDGQIGQMWQELERLKILDNTLVLFFSDHGESLFEHDLTGHTDFYQPTARVPLILYHPKSKKSVRVDSLVSLVDVMPMLLEILEVPSKTELQGKSPWRANNEPVFGTALGLSYIFDGRWKLMRDLSGGDFLYHIPSDPLETKDLTQSRNPWVKAVHKRLGAAMEEKLLSERL